MMVDSKVEQKDKQLADEMVVMLVDLMVSLKAGLKVDLMVELKADVLVVLMVGLSAELKAVKLGPSKVAVMVEKRVV